METNHSDDARKVPNLLFTLTTTNLNLKFLINEIIKQLYDKYF